MLDGVPPAVVHDELQESIPVFEQSEGLHEAQFFGNFPGIVSIKYQINDGAANLVIPYFLQEDLMKVSVDIVTNVYFRSLGDGERIYNIQNYVGPLAGLQTEHVGIVVFSFPDVLLGQNLPVEFELEVLAETVHNSVVQSVSRRVDDKDSWTNLFVWT